MKWLARLAAFPKTLCFGTTDQGRREFFKSTPLRLE